MVFSNNKESTEESKLITCILKNFSITVFYKIITIISGYYAHAAKDAVLTSTLNQVQLIAFPEKFSCNPSPPTMTWITRSWSWRNLVMVLENRNQGT